MKLPYVLLLVEVLLTATACSNQKTLVPGRPCVLNSECDSPLVCTLGKCHEACRANGDCSHGERCVLGGATDDAQSSATDVSSLRVCLLTDEEHCAFNSVCPSPLVCGRDLKCRNQCLEKVDCAKDTDECIVGGPNGEKVCAEPAAVDTNGELMSAPDAGTSASDAGAQADSGTGPDASVTADARAEAPVVTGVEEEPNDDQATATSYTPGTTVNASIGSATDIDTYKLIAPDDPAGGFYQGSFSSVGGGAISFRIVSATNNGTLEALSSGAVGQSRTFYWAAAPGQTYYLIVDPVTTTVFNYTLRVDYTAVKDDYEPNDVVASAKPIAVGTPVLATMFAGLKTSAAPAAIEYQDWFSVEQLLAGPTTIAVSGVPDNVGLRLRVFNAMNVQIAVTGGASANVNADFNGTLTLATAGKYYVVVDVSGALPIPSGTDAVIPVPDNFVSQYQLTVTQP